MQITVELVGFLKQTKQAEKLRAGALALPEGATLADALAQIGVTPDLPLMVTVNGGRPVSGQRLQDGDVIHLIPPIGGG